ncbi:PLP-dependent aminotransferase family protein [Thalassospira sp. TSL5-1]|uniref:aminotransferase-like domain-containing protein n=1 Tax=Thalassospira sp. TSL5-1 TaxID=1544451 RepID=UPI00093E7E55|nr:PLP-dependent aminotransferase family protein [Thalassospira sp. TSL5-1]OKH86837.1 GntR family transcriptional regulator [Thalassospira sp. TSL5-1]
MWNPWVKENARLKYIGIVDALEEDINNGLIAQGERLPSQRAIAEAVGVDLTTVTRAFNEARKRHLVDASPGRGTFIRKGVEVTGVVNDRLPLIDMSMNTPPQLAHMNFRRLFAHGMSDILSSKTGLLNLQYQESRGAEFDRIVAADWLSSRLGSVAPECVLLTAGAQVALYALCDLLLQRGDVLAAGNLTYPGLKAVALQRGLHLVGLEMDEHGIIPDSLEKACVEDRPKAIYLVPNIDNPTTATVPLERRAAIARIARKYRIAIIEDDPYWPLLDDRNNRAIASIAGDITWHIATLSKCASPALRIAYVVAPDPAQAQGLAAILRTTILMVPSLMSALASRWIVEGVLQDLVAAIIAENNARLALAKSELGRPFHANPNGHHIWLELPTHWSADNFARQAELAGVAVVPASAFAIGRSNANAVRISLGVSPDRETLTGGLRRLAQLQNPDMLSPRIIV